MIYDYHFVDYDRLCYLVKQRFSRQRDFAKLLWGNDTHLTLKYFIKRPDIQISTLVRIAEILDVSIDTIFLKSEIEGRNQSVVGNNNVVNCSHVNNVQSNLEAENLALRMVNEELKKQNERLGKTLDLALKFGHNSDKE